MAKTKSHALKTRLIRAGAEATVLVFSRAGTKFGRRTNSPTGWIPILRRADTTYNPWIAG
jgi:hypothetical protein